MSNELLISRGLRTIRFLIKGSSIIFGLILAGVSIWAVQLGIDNNSSFGPRRLGMLFLGIGFMLWAVWDWIGPKLTAVFVNGWFAPNRILFIRTLKGWLGAVWDKILESSLYLSVCRSANRISQTAYISWVRRHWLILSFVVVSILGVVAHLWIFSAGKMIIPTTGTKYYAWLADAFKEQQIHLLIKPSPGLLSLPNPYDHHLRSEVNYIWDASLYDGKYFLYWGPVPGLIVVIFQLFTTELIRDSFLVLGFVCGTFLFSALLLSAIWRRFSSIFPRWGYVGGILALALNVPMIWLLTRPAVYEASIAGGQFFLMAGLFWGFLAVSRSKLNYGFLALAGIAWAFAAGTRVNLIPAILILSLMVIWRVFQLKQRILHLAIVPVLAFMLPLIMGGLIIGGYNYARFGSIFEFGHRYQLTGPAFPESYDSVTSSAYSIPNLYNYLIRLPSLSGEFPFIIIPWQKSWPFFIQLPPDIYSAEPVAGILWLVPVTGLALLIFIRYLWLKVDQSLPQRTTPLKHEDRSLLGWLYISLAGGGILQLVLLMVFISSSLRYLADFTLFAILLVTIFTAQISVSFQLDKFRRGLLATLWLGASSFTAILAIIVNINGYEFRFEKNNPELYRYILGLFH